jgi:hypothetical protein
VHHHQARVDQVEPGRRRALGRDVVPQDLEARFRCLPAPPARPDAERVDAPERRGVEQVGEAGLVGPGYPLPHAPVPALRADALLIRHATALPQNR